MKFNIIFFLNLIKSISRKSFETRPKKNKIKKQKPKKKKNEKKHYSNLWFPIF